MSTCNGHWTLSTALARDQCPVHTDQRDDFRLFLTLLRLDSEKQSVCLVPPLVTEPLDLEPGRCVGVPSPAWDDVSHGICHRLSGCGLGQVTLRGLLPSCFAPKGSRVHASEPLRWDPTSPGDGHTRMRRLPVLTASLLRISCGLQSYSLTTLCMFMGVL